VILAGFADNMVVGDMHVVSSTRVRNLLDIQAKIYTPGPPQPVTTIIPGNPVNI
jgi:hypothetical protein